MILLIIGLLLFIGLVVIHEFGHFIMARRNGVEVEEFGIGFPPRLYKHKTKGGWLFTINLLPLGGFVKLKGEHDSDTEAGTFGAASLPAKTKIMAAGVVMNLITAFVLFTLLALIGIPKIVNNQFTVSSDTKVLKNEVLVSNVDSNSPAAKAKLYDHKIGNQTALKPGDQIINIKSFEASGAVEGKDVFTIRKAADLSKATRSLAGKPVLLSIVRHGDRQEIFTQLRSQTEVEASKKTGSPKGYLGVYPTEFTLQRSTWSAPVVALGLIKQFTVLTFQGLGKAVKGLGGLIAGAVTGNHTARSNGQKNASEQVSGPVGIFVILRDGSSLGFQFMLFIIAIISLTLAIMNILPIPALDGGRLWLTLVSRAFGKPLSQDKEEIINASGFVLLLVLIILITVVDVKRFF